MSQSCIPPDEAGLAEFAENFAEKFPIHGPTHGFSGEEVIANGVDMAFLIFLLKLWSPDLQKHNKEAVVFKKHMIQGSSALEKGIPVIPAYPDSPPAPAAGIRERLLCRINRLKLWPGYDPSVAGVDLRLIVIPMAKVDHPFPPLIARLLRGQDQMEVELAYKIYGHDGVNLQCKYPNEEWQDLSLDSGSPYIDRRPLREANTPEIRIYRTQWWDRGQAHGEWSPAIIITVTVLT